MQSQAISGRFVVVVVVAIKLDKLILKSAWEAEDLEQPSHLQKHTEEAEKGPRYLTLRLIKP